MKLSSGTVYFWQAEFGESFVGRRVLVTGATGFIGWHLCEALVTLGAEVHGLSRTASTKNLPRGCQSRAVDLRDYEAVKAVLSQLQPELIYHVAGMVTAQEDMALVMPMLQHNLIGTVHLLLVGTEAGCGRFVCVGSSEEPLEDKTDQVPSSPYAAAKMVGSIYARMFHRLYNFPLVLVRPFMVYGPRQEVTKLVAYTILSLLRGEPPQVSSCQRVYDFIYVLDVVRGLLKAGVQPGVVGEAIDLGIGRGSRIQDVVNLLVELIDSNIKPVFGAIPDRVGEESRIANREKTKRLLGWEPLWSLRDGLAETIAWYREYDEGRGCEWAKLRSYERRFCD